MKAFHVPSLLDRLVQGKSPRPGSPEGISLPEFKRIVELDLETLLKQPRFLFAPPEAEDHGPSWMSDSEKRFPLVEESVVNYGVAVPSGSVVSEEALQRIAVSVRTAIEAFEPRITNVTVKVDHGAEGMESGKRTSGESPLSRPSFLIEADLLVHPYVENLRLRTELNLISGELTVRP